MMSQSSKYAVYVITDNEVLYMFTSYYYANEVYSRQYLRMHYIS